MKASRNETTRTDRGTCKVQLVESGYFEILNHYFPGWLSSRVLVVKRNEESGFQVEVTEGHLLMFHFLVAEIIYRLPMRRIGCLASTVVT